MKKIIAYVRVSTQEQEDHGVSIEAQIARIKQYAEMQGYELVDILVDGGISASKPISTRPEGGRLVEIVNAKEADAVIAIKLDRLFRNTSDAITTIEDWDKKQIGLIILDMGGQIVDTSSAIGRFFITLMAGLSELELNQTRERTKAALGHKKATRQAYCHSVYGWTRRGDQLVRDEREQAVLKALVEARSKGVTLGKMVTALGRAGIKTKKGNEVWQRRTLSALVKNEGVREYDDLEAYPLDFA